MKKLGLVAGVLMALAASTSHAGTVCKVASDKISTLEIQRDGGEETLTITSVKNQKTRLLVTRNYGGVTIAIVDSAVTADNSNSGIMMAKNPNGSSTVAIDGQILQATCSEN